jgi:MFS family permease
VAPAATATATVVKSLWRDGNFNRFWLSQAFDAIGDSFARMSMPLLVLEFSGSVSEMGRVTAIIGLASLLAGITSSLFVDLLDRRRLLMFCDFGRMLVYALIPFSVMLLGKTVWPVYVVAAVAGYLNSVFFIGLSAAIPGLVDDHHLLSANGRIQATVGLSFVVGPMLAGLAAGLLGPRLSIGLVALLYGSSLALMAFVRMRAKPVDEAAPKKGPVLEELLGGVRFMLAHPMLKWAAILFALVSFLSEAAIDLAIFRLENELHLSKTTIGIVFGIASLGAVLAGALAQGLRRRWGFGACFLGSLLLQGLAIMGLGRAFDLWTGVVAAMLFTFGFMLRNINTMSLRQQVTPSHLLGRVSAAFWTVIAVTGPVGALLATSLAEVNGAATVLMGMGLMGAMVAVAGLFTPARTREAK